MNNLFAYKIINSFSSNYSIGEILLNTLFILIIIIISTILYWDNINTKVSALSRCKRQMEVYNNSNNQYVVHATDKEYNKLFDVIYDTNQYNTNVECKCEPGKYINNFENILVKDMKKNKDVKVNKSCSCDKYYNIGMDSENIIYEGDPGIIRYMTTKNSDFFDDLVFAAYK